jgi:hypothetical protein
MPSDCIQQVELKFMIERLQILTLFCALATAFVGAPAPLRAQAAGPMQLPESRKLPPLPPPGKADAPSLPPDEIIRRFAANEDAMARAIKGYTFQKEVRVQEIAPDGKAAGQLAIVTQLRISADGKLTEKPVSRQDSTLHYLDLQRGDSDLVAAVPMFPLTTAMLPKYQITYGGKQQLDDLSVYYFTIKPRALDRAYAYFSGVVWVDQQDLVIVKMMGKWVTETGDVTASDLPFAVFETYRQEIAKNLWFPGYSRSDETFESGKTQVPIRMIIKWSDFTPVAGAPAMPNSPASSGTP